jgi:hypothetical protein
MVNTFRIMHRVLASTNIKLAKHVLENLKKMTLKYNKELLVPKHNRII